MEIKTTYSKPIALILAIVILISIVGVLVTRIPASAAGPVPGPIIEGEEGFHVIVTSGEPEGVAAALSAARNGLRTLLIERGDALGGLMTLGRLNILDNNYLGHFLITQGIFNEFYSVVGDGFEIQEAKDWFMNAVLAEPNITLMMETDITETFMDGNRISGLEVRDIASGATQIVRSLVVIDATVDGDIAAAAGAPYTWGGEDHGAHWYKQGVTLVFEVADVDWMAVVRHFRTDGSLITGADARRAWGFVDEARNYVSVDGNMRFRGPNMARQDNGNVLLNAMIIFGVDALDPASLQDGIERGRREIPHIIEFMRQYFVGFENAVYAGHAPRLYVRETRHFIGEYRLTITDVLQNRDHWDSIGHGRYPVDLQPTGPYNLGTIIGVPYKFSIPFRSLVPLEIDGLLVVGRAASFDSLPHGSTRVMPIGMVSAEAAGVAAAYSLANGVTFREMTQNPASIRRLQNQLRRQGAHIVPFEAPREPVMNHWAYPGMVIMRTIGQAQGGYFNDYGLDNYVTSRWALQSRFNQMMRVINERTEYRGAGQIPAWLVHLDSDDITVGTLFRTAAKGASLGDPELLQAGGISHGQPFEFTNAEEARAYLTKRGVLNVFNSIYFPSDTETTATIGQIMSVLGNLYNVLMEK